MKLCLDFINFMFLFRKSTKYQLFIAHGPLTDPRNKNSFSQNCSEKFSHEAKYIQVALCHDNLDCGSRKTEDNLIFFWGGKKTVTWAYISFYTPNSFCCLWELRKLHFENWALECCIKGHIMRREHVIGKQISDLLSKIVSQRTF